MLLPEQPVWRGGQLRATYRSPGNIQEYSVLDAKWRNSVIIKKGLVVDNLAKTLVTLMIPPTPSHFCLKDPGIFRERLLKNGRLAVVVERRGSTDPEWRWVEQIDGRVMVLKSPLNYTPHEGACVAILIGVDSHFFDAKALEQGKERYRWT